MPSGHISDFGPTRSGAHPMAKVAGAIVLAVDAEFDIRVLASVVARDSSATPTFGSDTRLISFEIACASS